MKSILPYLGGKSRLAPRIVESFPTDHTCYCEPFCGACWVFLAKEKSHCEVINDLDGDLVTFWRVVQNHLEEFLRYYRFAVTSRTLFELELKKVGDTLTDIQRAVRYFYLQKLSFGGKSVGRTFGTTATGPSRLNLVTLEDSLLEIHWRMKGVTIEHLQAIDCVRRYDRPDTLFYLDPPYYETAGYAVPFGEEDYHNLRDVLASIAGRVVLSLNDHPFVRTLFKGFQIQRLTLKYSASRSVESRSTPVHEVLIRNF